MAKKHYIVLMQTHASDDFKQALLKSRFNTCASTLNEGQVDGQVREQLLEELKKLKAQIELQ